MQSRLSKMSNNIIKHRGIVTNITGPKIETSIIVSSACAGCHAKGACGTSDSSSRTILIEKTNHNVNIGDSVSIEGAQSTGLKAVFFAYVLPFIVVMTTLVLSSVLFKTTELRAGLYSLMILPPYYLILHFFKGKFEKSYTFRIV